MAVGFAGLFFVVLGFVTGPLPGPGGIPLVLLGLAIWASEFEWAHKLMQWFKAQLHRYPRLAGQAQGGVLGLLLRLLRAARLPLPAS